MCNQVTLASQIRKIAPLSTPLHVVDGGNHKIAGDEIDNLRLKRRNIEASELHYRQRAQKLGRSNRPTAENIRQPTTFAVERKAERFINCTQDQIERIMRNREAAIQRRVASTESRNKKHVELR